MLNLNMQVMSAQTNRLLIRHLAEGELYTLTLPLRNQMFPVIPDAVKLHRRGSCVPTVGLCFGWDEWATRPHGSSLHASRY